MSKNNLANYIITLFLTNYIIQGTFTPNLIYKNTIDQGLSFPYYAKFNNIMDKFGQYSLWISNNPYRSPLSNCGYIAQFKYNPKNLSFELKSKINAPNILGLAPCNLQDSVYPGIKSYVTIPINNKYLLELTTDHEFTLYNYTFNNCQKINLISSFSQILGMPKNLKISPYKYIVNGIKYQLIAIPYSYLNTSNNNIESLIIIFQYPINYPNSLLYPAGSNPLAANSGLNINLIVINTFSNTSFSPNDVEFSPFSSTDGAYLLAFTNANASVLSLFKINMQNPANMTITPYKTIEIGNYNQNFTAFSNNRYLAVDTIDFSNDNLYAYYFDENFNIKTLNNGLPYKTGSLPQALTWSPDSKALIIPNYLDNNFTVYQANTCAIKVELKPKVSVQYPDGSSKLTAKVYNGTPPYTFYFSNGQVIKQDLDIASITVSPEQTTIYNVTVVDANNCITGIADPVTVQVAKPIINSIVPNCKKNIIKIKGIILDTADFPVINTTMELFIDSDKSKKIYVTSNNSGFFKYKYKIN